MANDCTSLNGKVYGNAKQSINFYAVLNGDGQKEKIESHHPASLTMKRLEEMIFKESYSF